MNQNQQPVALQLADTLRACAEDPMWADHTEISKRTCNRAEAELRRLHDELETLTLYKSLADEYGLSIFKDLKDLTTELETLREKLKTYEDLGDAGSDVHLLRMGYAAARLEIESLRGKGWQPIETAPKDGTLILAAINIHCSDGTAAWQRHAIYFDAERLKSPAAIRPSACIDGLGCI